MTLLDTPPVTAVNRPSWTRAALSATALLLLAAGVPVALALLVGSPLPHHVPTGQGLRHVLTAPVSGRAVVDVFACLAWLAWAHLIGSITVEVAVQVRGRRYPRHWPRRLPTQTIAHHLVTGLLLALPTAPVVGHALPAAAVTPATATVHRVATLPAVYPVDPAPAAPAARSSALNEHRPARTPHVSSAATRQPPLKRYVVSEPRRGQHDSLWDIADRHLGDPLRYREIYQLNKGRLQPDGGELTEASLIRPGWVLYLPADAHGPGVETVSPSTPRQTQANAGPQAVPAPDEPPPSDTVDQPAEVRVGESPIARIPDQPGAAHADPPPRDGGTHATRQHRLPLDLGIGLAALAALAALDRARRVAQRRRPLRRRIAPLPDDLRHVETELRRQARHAEPLAAAVRLATALTATVEPQPHVRAITRRTDGTVDLHLDQPLPPVAPFVGAPHRWQLPPGAVSYGFAVDDTADPYPALVPVGHDADGQVLVDIEPAGFTVVTGDIDAASAIAATAAGSLLGAPWASPPVQVHVPAPLATRLGDLEHLNVVTDLTETVEALRGQCAVVRREVAAAGVTSLPELRRAGGADITCLLAFVGWRTSDLPEELVELAKDPSTPVLVLATGDDDRASADWDLDGTTMRIPSLDLTVTVVPDATDADAGELLAHTRSAPDVPVETAGGKLTADAPPQHDAAAIEIRVLGPVDIVGVPTPRRTPVLAMLVYLALHRRGVDAETVATALWPDKLVAGKTMRNRISEARTLVGSAISDGPGWKLDDRVGCDWQRFQALAAGDISAKRAALALVRGRPFQGLLDADWVDLEGFRTEIESAVVDVAVDVAEHTLTVDDDPVAAFAAARIGLSANPYEERLYRLAMRAADAQGSTGKVRALMRELQNVLDIEIEPDDELEDETLETYRELVGKALRNPSAS